MHVPAIGQPGQHRQPAVAGLPARLGLGVQRDRRVHRVQPGAQRRRRVVGQPAHRGGQPGADPHDQRPGHLGQRRRVRAPHVAVAQRPHQRGQRRHQAGHVLVQRRLLVQRPQHLGQRVRQVGQQRALHRGRHRDQVAGPAGRIGDLRAGRRGHRGAPQRRVDDRDRQLGPPAQDPALAERPRGAHRVVGDLAPADVQGPQPVQQHRPVPVELLAEVQRDRLVERVDPELQRLGPGPQVHLQRHRLRALRDLAQPLADHQVAGHEVRRHLVAAAQHRPGRLADLGQPGQRPAAQRRQRLGQPDRLDDVRRGDRQVAAAQHPRHPGQPPGHHMVRGGEQVVVPARRGHPRAVARRRRQPRVGPRHPGQRGLALGRSAQQRRVGRGGRELARQRRGMPGAADHGDHSVGLPDGGAQDLAHVGLAPVLLLLPLPRRGRRPGPQLGHGLGQRGERRLPVHPRLDDVVPPPLGVVVPGRAGQQRDRVLPRAPAASWRRQVAGPASARRPPASVGSRSGGAARLGSSASSSVGQDHRRGQVAEAHRHLVLGGPAQRLPFGREHRERPERGDPR